MENLCNGRQPDAMGIEPCLTLGSLFDGSGGFAVAGMLHGIVPVWASEIEPFPIRVTTRRIPQMKHYGDICKIDGARVEPVSVITFGSPCTSFSLAGRRDGIQSRCPTCGWETNDGAVHICPECGAGAEVSASSLFFEAIRVIEEMLNATNRQFPRYLVMENVPGMLSSSGGSDFKKILAEFKRLGFAVDIDILNAERMGVAQRRKRVFIAAVRQELVPGWAVQNKLPVEKAVERAMKDYDGIRFYGIVTAPFAEVRSLLSDILEHDADRKYYLSAKACQGILRRAGVRGKQLPEMLRIALEKQARGEAGGNGQGGHAVAFKPGAMSRLGGHYDEEQSCTILAQMGDNQVCVALESTLYANTPMVMGERQKGLPVTENIAQTLMGTDHKGVQCIFENHSQDTRYTGPLETAGTVSATYGMGGNNQPFVVSNVPKTLKIRSGCEGGGKGALIQEDKSATLSCNNEQAVFVPKAYGISSYQSNGMLSDNPESGVYEADTSKTIDQSGGDPSRHQGGIAIVDNSAYTIQGSAIGRQDENGPRGSGINKEVCFTLNTIDKPACCYQERTGSLQARDFKGVGSQYANEGKLIVDGQAPTVGSFYPQMKAESQCYREDGTADTIVNGTNPGYQNGIVGPSYTVRRLTPTECAALQGFDKNWCADLNTDNPMEEDIAFWAEVFETHRLITKTSTKPKSRKQIVKWLKDSYTDGAAYKMWGNGVALPCVSHVMSGMVRLHQAISDTSAEESM